MQFLLNHSILIVFLLVTAVVGYRENRRYLQRTGLDFKEFVLLMEARSKLITRELLAKLATALIISVVVSAVSFREFFLIDVFHTVFLTMLMVKPVYGYLKRLFE